MCMYTARAEELTATKIYCIFNEINEDVLPLINNIRFKGLVRRYGEDVLPTVRKL